MSLGMLLLVVLYRICDCVPQSLVFRGEDCNTIEFHLTSYHGNLHKSTHTCTNYKSVNLCQEKNMGYKLIHQHLA